MPRGGRRNGQPGKQYANRTDLTQAPKAAPGQQYGAAKQQLDAQAAVPLPTQAAGGAPPMQAPAQPMTLPGSLGALDQPSARPNEPITAGMSSGPGPGPGVVAAAQGNPVLDELRGIYRVFPNEDLRRLIAEAELA